MSTQGFSQRPVHLSFEHYSDFGHPKISKFTIEKIETGLGLCIVYFKLYDVYHDTHEAIFDMYQWYILSGFSPKKNLIYPQISQEFGYFSNQNILNLSKNVSFEVLIRLTKMNDTISIA